MDDQYEKPSFTVPKVDESALGDAEQSSDEDDGGPDWTRLAALAPSSSTSSSKAIIPKRGDKEFEPTGGSDGGGKGTNLQQHKLERVREAMFSALDIERTVSSKVASYAVWCPEASRARILTARGNFLSTMGHNVPRNYGTSASTSTLSEARKKVERAVELVPEEALYLIERGSLFCWSRLDHEMSEEGTPMSLQQAYAEMIGKEDLTLERYQVYAYLKRLGYTVTRARPPDPYYSTAPRYSPIAFRNSHSGVLAQIASTILCPFRLLFASNSGRIDWWRPLRSGLMHRFLSYSSIFSALRFIPSAYSRPRLGMLEGPAQSSPYEVFFHLYKPTTPYRKTAPSPPDYSVIVVDARKTPIPTFRELCGLFEQLPELPPPVPRKRSVQSSQSTSLTKKGPEPENQSIMMASSLYTRLYNLFRWLLRLYSSTSEKEKSSPGSDRRPNPFQMLRLGKKMIVVAAVDAGMISFFRFYQGSFDDWPMV
ncbi:SEN54 [Sanghuangporus weigelae]